ncbi:MAG: BTAD domain-containing putative transcriptional regulator [Candidatus Limnocylindria bacterium]
MRFAVLGPLRVISRSDVALDRRAHRRLLSILLVESGRPLDTEVIIDRFWGDEPPETARAALQTYVSQLRRLLGEELIVRSGSGYLLDLRGQHLDSQVFNAFASAARTALDAGAWHEVLNDAERALALWRGPPFPELQGDEFAMAEIARLEELRIELVEMRAEALLTLGRTEDALPDLERFVIEYPLRERLREHLMVARARLGRVSEALETYQDLRRTLGEMGLEPASALRELEERILQEDPVLVPSRVRNNLPARLKTFVGRSVELQELGNLLSSSRMVTLTGVGGTGKTSLAIELAQGALASYPDGVYLVSLGALEDPGLVATDTAEVMGLRVERRPAADVLADALRHRKVLILLDNCEHLLEACANLSEVLLQSGPGVSVLATSREALRTSGEKTYAVPPLETPPPDDSVKGQVEDFDAVRLFIERAALVSRDFALTGGNAAAVAEICRRLDGLPLAIELAAARVHAMEPEDIASRLSDRFRLLREGSRTSPPRQQTLHATIDWSYRLLEADERVLFERLSVFVGGCPLDAAEAVGSGEGIGGSEILDLLSRLVDKCMVILDLAPTGEARYRMLETIREFARDHLGQSEAASVWLRHRDWFFRLAERAIAQIDGSDQRTWLDRLHADRDNVAAALVWSLDNGDDREAAMLAEAMGWYRVNQGHYQQAVDHMRIALDQLEPWADVEREAAIRVRLAGTMYKLGDQSALAEAKRARSLVAGAPPSLTKVRALTEFATIHLRLNPQDPAPSIMSAREAVIAAGAINDPFAESHALRELGAALGWAGEIEEGVARLRDALAISRRSGNPQATLGVYMRLYITLLDLGHRRDETDTVADEAIAWLDAGADRWVQSSSLLMWFAMGFMRSGRWARAEEALDRSSRHHPEGTDLMSFLALRCLLHWSQGRLDEADTDLAALRAAKPTRLYHRVRFPTEANTRFDEGRLDEVRRLANAHLAAEVAPMEESTKSGTLHALVRAEIDAALDLDGPMRADHLRRAREAVETMRDLIARFPPGTLTGLQLEIADIYLLLAEAELTRATAPQPDLWRVLLERPSYAYWRLYAHCRLGEALLAANQNEKALRELDHARLRASELGAVILRDEIDSVARRGGVPLVTAGSQADGHGVRNRRGRVSREKRGG